MDKTPIKYKTHCPINVAQETFGDRWSLLIIRDIMFFGKKTYGDFLGSNEKISTNILANRLSKLEEKGLLEKSEDENNKSKNIYSLTQKGVDLMPILLEMIVWSAKHDKDTEAPAEFVEQLHEDRGALLQELKENIGISLKPIDK